MTDQPAEDREKLHETCDSVVVSLRAAEEYGRFAGLRVEEARRQLTLHALDAHHVEDWEDGSESWRRRSRPIGIDLALQVARDGRLAIVTTVSCRGTPRPSPDRPSVRRRRERRQGEREGGGGK